MPYVEFERADLPEPEQRRQVVGEQIPVLLVLVLGEDGDRLDELGQLLRPVLLEETLAVDALGHADHGERAVREVRKHEARDACEIAEKIARVARFVLPHLADRPLTMIRMPERSEEHTSDVQAPR